MSEQRSSSPQSSQRNTKAREQRVWLRELFRGRQREALDQLTSVLSERGGSLRLPSPLGRSFLVTHDASFLRRVLVTSAARYDTSDVRGVETYFRADTLPNGEPAWRVMHSLANRFPTADAGFRAALEESTDTALSAFRASPSPEHDLSVFASSLWGDTLAYVLFGRAVPGLSEVIATAFHTLLGRLASPLIHALPGFVHVPTPENRRFRRTVHEARAAMAAEVQRGPSSDWCVTAQLAREIDPAFLEADQLEIGMAFFFNSSATVSSTLAWLLWHIASDATLQRRLHPELTSARTPLLDACLAETLRMYTPIHLGRHAREDDEVEGEDTVRAGTDVISNAWLIHRNPTVWSEPNTFRPERFADRRVTWSEYLPFSMGPRGCPGRNLSYAAIRQITQQVLAQFKLETIVTKGDKHAEGPPFQRSLIVPTLPSRLPVRVLLRHDSNGDEAQHSTDSNPSLEV